MFAIKWQHCSGTEWENLMHQSTVNTEALKTILTYNSVFYLSIYDHFFHFKYSWLGNIYLDIDQHLAYMHSIGWWSFSAYFFPIKDVSYIPHLPGGSMFLWIRESPSPGGAISELRCITVRGMLWGVVISRRRLIFIYFGDHLWWRFWFGSSCE